MCQSALQTVESLAKPETSEMPAAILEECRLYARYGSRSCENVLSILGRPRIAGRRLQARCVERRRRPSDQRLH
jgi:hypothetical protein